MTDTTAPRTAADHLVYPGGPPCADNCPGDWSQYHDGYSWGFEHGHAEAIEPLLALVRAAMDEVGTGPTYELDRALAALPESVRVAARKPE